jgi:hypothetical protein
MQNDDEQSLPQLFIGVFPCGISYTDRHHEKHGDYKSLAFLPYSSLVLEFRKDCPAEFRSEIIASAAAIQVRKGEQYQISGCGQTVLLGGEKAARENGIASPTSGD